MMTERVSASEAQQRVRNAREQIWIRPGFVEQLVLFGICGFQPHAGHPIYHQWRLRMDEALRARRGGNSQSISSSSSGSGSNRA
jgi:dual specificity phosphatase 12